MSPQEGRKKRQKAGESTSAASLANKRSEQCCKEPRGGRAPTGHPGPANRLLADQEPLVTRGWLKKEAAGAKRGDVAAGTSQRKKQWRAERALAGGSCNWERGQDGDTEPVKQRDSPGRPERRPARLGQSGPAPQQPLCVQTIKMVVFLK